MNCDPNVLTSYGASTILIGYLTGIEFLKLQAVNRFMYQKGVGRIQKRIDFYEQADAT